MELTWLVSGSASALHAADALMSGLALVDGRVGEALAEPVRRLRSAIAGCPAPFEKLWQQLLVLSAEIESNYHLVELALRKAAGPKATSAPALVAAITEVEEAMRGLFPRLADELGLRGRPLRELWEARGPGLMVQLGRLTDELVVAPQARVVLVQPVLGGGGRSFIPYNAIHIEALLANPWPQLPEVVRLAWLLAPLQLELPHFSEQVLPLRLPRVAGLAMLPPVLEAAHRVELIGPVDEQAVEEALRLWRVDSPQGAGELLWQWWQTYQEDRPSWPLALRALDHMLNDDAS